MVVIKLKNSILQAPPDKYKKVEEFYTDMYTSEEIIFEYCAKKYIVAYYEDKLSVAECNKPETEQTFASPEEFADNYLLNGVKFKEIITQIDILVR